MVFVDPLRWPKWDLVVRADCWFEPCAAEGCCAMDERRFVVADMVLMHAATLSYLLANVGEVEEQASTSSVFRHLIIRVSIVS